MRRRKDTARRIVRAGKIGTIAFRTRVRRKGETESRITKREIEGICDKKN